MKKSLLLLLGLFLTGPELFAQQNYIPGFIVSHENDTTYGWIDYQNWGKNPSAISFREDSAAPAKRYNPGQIQYFQVAEDHYVSREVSIDKTPSDIDKLTNSPVTERDSLFLLAYVQGPAASLYYYEDEKPHFFIVKDSTYSELISRRLLRYQDGKRIALRQEDYKTQLRVHFSDCPRVTEDLDHLGYRPGEMVTIFRRYNECKGSETLYVKEKILPETEFRLIGGLSVTQPSVYLSPNNNLSEYSRSVNPLIGFSFNIIFPRNRARWSMYNEIIYTAHYSMENRTSSKVGGSYVKMTNVIRYHVPGISGRPFLNLGLSNALAMHIKQSEYVSVLSSKKKRKYLRGYVLGLGTHLQNLSVEIRFDSGSSTTPSFTYFFRIASVTIGIPIK